MKIKTKIVGVGVGVGVNNYLINSDYHIPVGTTVEIEIPDPPKTPGQKLYEMYRSNQTKEIRSCWEWFELGQLSRNAWEETAKKVKVK